MLVNNIIYQMILPLELEVFFFLPYVQYCYMIL